MRIVVCGIGNAERGDDAFGPYIIAHLRETDVLKKYDCGLYPENYLNKLLAFSPDLVIFLDTISTDSPHCVLLKNEQILERSPVSVSTHSLSLAAMYEFLIEGGVKDVFFLGVPVYSYRSSTVEVQVIADRIVEVLNDIDKSHHLGIIEIYEALSEQIR